MIPIYVRPPKALNGSKKGIKWDDPHCSLQQIKYKKLFLFKNKNRLSRLRDIHLLQTYEPGPRAWSTRHAPCSSAPRCFGQQISTYIVKALSVVHNHHVPPPPPPWRIHEESMKVNNICTMMSLLQVGRGYVWGRGGGGMDKQIVQ
jgi:hypothetical protein